MLGEGWECGGEVESLSDFFLGDIAWELEDCFLLGKGGCVLEA